MEFKTSFLLLLVISSLLLSISCAAPQESRQMQYYYRVATPSPPEKRPPLTRYEQGLEDYDEEQSHFHKQTSEYPVLKEPDFAPSQFIMTVLKTVLNVIRNVNKKRTQNAAAKENVLKKVMNQTEAFNRTDASVNVPYNKTTSMASVHPVIRSGNMSTNSSKARGYDDIGVISYVDDHHDHYHDHEVMVPPSPPPPPPLPPSTMQPMKQSRYSDPWEGYYDFIITEGSFKFWSGFQLFTALLLLYSALAAIYYAKFNPIQPDYDTTYDDYFFGRSLEASAPEPDPKAASPAPGWITSIKDMGSAAYSRIIDVISSPNAPNSNHSD